MCGSVVAAHDSMVGDRDKDEARWSEWLVRAQAGDQEAYGALLGELVPLIRAYLISRFGHLDNLDDCVQESLLAVHQARHTYDGKRPFRPWLFAIVRNRTIDQLRRLKHHANTQDGTETEPAAASSGASADIDTGRLLGTLSKNLRETLVLTKIMGYSVRECADRQGVSESVVKVRVHRGLRKLRALCELEAN